MKAPIRSRKNQAFEANATAGHKAERTRKRSVRGRVLDCVTDLVGADRRRRDRDPVVYGLGEEDGALARVVMVGERPAR